MENNFFYKLNDYSDKYTEHIVKKYDLQQENLKTVSIPLINKDELATFDWNVGVICGNSGSGKSSILKEQFNYGSLIPSYDNSKPLVSQFEDYTPEEICSLFESVGLSSIPVWLRTPNQLSVGEKARFDLCWYLINAPKDNPIVIDEFTSTVNRECALSMAYTLQRYVRSKNLKLVLSSCHFDIIDYLNPDWVYNLNKQSSDGVVELERIIYSNEPYKEYGQVHQKDILTPKMAI